MRFYSYQSSYLSNTLRGVDIEQRPELAQDLAKSYGGQEKSLLDIGCGPATKLQHMAKSFQLAIGLDPSIAMINEAKRIVHQPNIHLTQAIAQKLPFKNKTFDVVTAILTWWTPFEINRVLKEKGVFILECLSPGDKSEFTTFFGKDNQGWRGAELNNTLSEKMNEIKQKLSPFFTNIEIQNKTWSTLYTENGLWQLLCNTYSTVRNFDPKKDQAAFNKAIDALSLNGEVILPQSRLVITAVK